MVRCQVWGFAKGERFREDLSCDEVHGRLVIVGTEQVAVSIHGHLQAAVAGKGLDRLGREPGFDPHSEAGDYAFLGNYIDDSLV